VVYRADDPDLREPFAPGSLSAHFRHTDAEGRRYRERTLGGKTYRYYADEGRRRGSVWTDIPAMSANSPVQAEATGYPTQKPLRLLQRIVRASTHPEMRVLDPMCGSGTTLVAAASLGRSFVGIDASSLAVSVARSRLAAAGVELEG
jgi:site-specific DNA-methyltransferase (adenine-specific)